MPKDYNTLTDERIIQLSGNDKSVEFCKKEIKVIVGRIAPLLEIKLDDFKRNKKNIKFNFEKLIEEKRDAMQSSFKKSDFFKGIKTESYDFDATRPPKLLD